MIRINKISVLFMETKTKVKKSKVKTKKNRQQLPKTQLIKLHLLPKKIRRKRL